MTSLPAPEYTLRFATDADRPFLRDLYASVRASELAVVPWSAEQRRAFCDDQFGLQDRHYRTHYPGAQFLIVEVDGRPVGRLYRALAGGELRLLDVALLPSMRGQGIGSRLLREFVAEADAGGHPAVLYVEPENPARRLYARLGFEPRESFGVYLRMTRAPSPR